MASGQGRDGPFKPYSPSYLRQLRKAGQPTQVDLSLTGAFMKAFRVLKSGRKKAKLGWKSTSTQNVSLTESGMRPTGTSIDHQELARKIAKDRFFLHLDKEQRTNVARLVLAVVKAWFKKRAKKS